MPKPIEISKSFLEEKYINEQLSKQQIADILNCSYGCIHNKLKKYGIPIRSRQEALKIDANRPEKIKWAREKMLGDKNIIHLPGVREKVGRDMSGKKNPNWKNPEDRKSTLNFAIRGSEKYDQWRRKILKRDDYACQICKIRGTRLHVDHIKPFCIILEENGVKTKEDGFACKELWDTNNGRVLCKKCHKKTDTFGINARNYL